MADFIMNQKKTANFGRSKPAWRSWRTVLFKRKQEELPSLCLLWFSLAYFSPKNLFLHFVQDVRHTKRPCAVWCRAFLLCIRVNDLYCWENKPVPGQSNFPSDRANYFSLLPSLGHGFLFAGIAFICGLKVMEIPCLCRVRNTI